MRTRPALSRTELACDFGLDKLLLLTSATILVITHAEGQGAWVSCGGEKLEFLPYLFSDAISGLLIRPERPKIRHPPDLLIFR